MSLGALALKVRQKYEHGLQVAHYRDTVRPYILSTKPISHTNDRTCEIHVLTCANDWINLIWTLKTFYHYSNRRYALCIHGDKSLNAEHQQILQMHFPQARLVDWNVSQSEVLPWLSLYPNCQKLRSTRFISIKEFDFFYYLNAERMLILDSDILFFSEPTELLRRIEDNNYYLNSVNRDIDTAYSVDPEILEKRLEIKIIRSFNSGLGLIHRSSVQLEWLEEFLTIPEILDHPWRFEQTLMALCSSRFGVELLPPEYDVHLEGGINGSPCRHYVGKIRHLMYGEGIRHLTKNGFLSKLNR